MSKIILRTNRLILRHFESGDLGTIYKYRNDVRCNQYQVYQDKTLGELEFYLNRLKSAKLGVGSIQLAIALKTTNQLIGDIFLDFSDDNISLGYTIDANYHRQGYAYEVLFELFEYLKKHYRQKYILAKVFVPNVASIGLLYKLGFKKISLIKEEATYVFEYKLR